MPFKPGNKLGGRPKNAKSVLPEIRQLLTNEAHRRWKIKANIKGISDERLLNAIIALMPKENLLKLDMPIRYVTHLPDGDRRELIDITPSPTLLSDEWSNVNDESIASSSDT